MGKGRIIWCTTSLAWRSEKNHELLESSSHVRDSNLEPLKYYVVVITSQPRLLVFIFILLHFTFSVYFLLFMFYFL